MELTDSNSAKTKYATIMNASPYAVLLEDSNILISLSTYSDLRADIRSVFEVNGKVYATKRGVPIQLDILPDIIKALQMISRKAADLPGADEQQIMRPKSAPVSSRPDRPKKYANKDVFPKKNKYKKSKSFLPDDEQDVQIDEHNSD